MREKEVRELYEAYTSIYEGTDDDMYVDKKTGKPHTWESRRKALEDKKNKIKTEEVEQFDEDKNYDRNRQRAAQRAAARNEARKQGKTGNVPGVGYVSPRPERETYRDSAGVERHTSGARMPKKKVEEETDLFDYILEHLVAEGYADTNENALAIMANMSEEWRQSIVEQDLTARQKYLMKKVGDMNAEKPGSAHTAVPGKQSAGGALDRANRSAMQLRGV